MFKLSRLLSLGLILIILATPGCSKEINKDKEPLVEAPKELDTQMVTVVVPVSIENEQYKQYAEKLLLVHGFDLEFVGYDKGQGYMDYEAYLDFCMDINKERENVVMIMDSQVPNSNAAEIFEDVTDKYKSLAPKHFEMFSNKDEKEQYGIVTAANYGIQSQRLAVLVRNEYLENYDKSIRTATEYEAFLEWAHENIEDGRTPGLIPAYLYEKAYHNTYVPYDLFMPELGYISLAPALPINVGGVYIENKEQPVENTEIFALESLPQFKDAALRLRGWVENDWIDVVNYELNTPKIEQYASVVVNPADYNSKQLEFWFPGNTMRVDATEFTMFIIYPDEIPNPWLDTFQPVYYAYALKGSDNPGSFLTFIEWLFIEEDNFRLFAGLSTDTADDANKAPDQNYSQWPTLTFFYNSKWADSSSVAPSNYEEEMAQVTNYSLPLIKLLMENKVPLNKMQTEIWNQNDYKSIGDREKAHRQLMRDLYIEKRADSEALIEQFIQQQKYTKELELKIQQMIRKIHKEG